jgi:hypothetical protein
MFLGCCQMHQLYDGSEEEALPGKNAPPELWSQEALSDNEYKLYNPGDRCLWEIMLEFFDQNLWMVTASL